nr:PREDICTED: katanin p60 ATPase-containing subunit A-like 2 [Apteryx mantelli mantelli]
MCKLAGNALWLISIAVRSAEGADMSKLTRERHREEEEMRTEARRKNLLILILHYLMEEGYIDAANALEQETKLGLRGFEVCDNIDLETILMEYESYYFVKFQKYPKITKKVLDTGWE